MSNIDDDAIGDPVEDALHTNPLVTALKSQRKDTVALSGYLEKLDNMRCRLYRNLNMDEYIEFENGPDVVFAYQVAKDKQLPINPKTLEPAIIWFTPDAKVTVSFLAGTIAALYMPRVDTGPVLGQNSQTILAATSIGGGCSTKLNCGCGQ